MSQLESASNGNQPFFLHDYPVQKVDTCLSNTLIEGRFKIIDYIDKGSFGEVLSVADAGVPKSPALVIKVMTNTVEFFDEVVAMKRIYKKALSCESSWGQKACPVPRITACGLLFLLTSKEHKKEDFTFEAYERSLGREMTVKDLKEIGKVNPYIVMPRYGMNLSDFFVSRKLKFSNETVVDLGLRVIEQLKAVHKAGYVFNDLKPDNIMLQYNPLPLLEEGQESSLKGVDLHLIDFGFCSKYKSRETGQLFAQKELTKFRGNLRYASTDQLSFLSTGRKDDLMSLCYILLFLLFRGKFLDTQLEVNFSELDPRQKMKLMFNMKAKHTPEQLCKGQAARFLPFVRAVFKLEFLDKPDYDELSSLLKRAQGVKQLSLRLSLRSDFRSHTETEPGSAKYEQTAIMPIMNNSPHSGQAKQGLHTASYSTREVPSFKQVAPLGFQTPKAAKPKKWNATCGLSMWEGLFKSGSQK